MPEWWNLKKKKKSLMSAACFLDALKSAIENLIFRAINWKFQLLYFTETALVTMSFNSTISFSPMHNLTCRSLQP